MAQAVCKHLIPELLKSALGGIEIRIDQIPGFLGTKLKSALGGIEMQKGQYPSSRKGALKSALGGIEIQERQHDSSTCRKVKISPWRD